jgi:hypothetical protein
VGSGSANVTVQDATPPSLSLTVSPSHLPPDLRSWTITVTPTMSDDCGGPVSLQLVSIKSNAPSFDAADIVGATVGTDDRSFRLFSRLAPGGAPRVYAIRYRATDARGNLRTVSATVTVS